MTREQTRRTMMTGATVAAAALAVTKDAGN